MESLVFSLTLPQRARDDVFDLRCCNPRQLALEVGKLPGQLATDAARAVREIAISGGNRESL